MRLLSSSSGLQHENNFSYVALGDNRVHFTVQSVLQNQRMLNILCSVTAIQRDIFLKWYHYNMTVAESVCVTCATAVVKAEHSSWNIHNTTRKKLTHPAVLSANNTHTTTVLSVLTASL